MSPLDQIMSSIEKYVRKCGGDPKKAQSARSEIQMAIYHLARNEKEAARDQIRRRLQFLLEAAIDGSLEEKIL